MKNYIPFLLVGLMIIPSAQAELNLWVEENIDTDTVTFTISGTANIDGLTPAETRSGAAYFGGDGFRFGPDPVVSDPLANHVAFSLFTLDPGYPASFHPAVNEGLQGNRLFDGTRPSEIAFTNTVGLLQWENLYTPGTINAFLALPANYSGETITNQVTFANSSLADFNFEDAAFTNGVDNWVTWGNGQDGFNLQTSVIPEPATTGLFALTSITLLGIYRLKKKTRLWETDTAPSDSENIL
jgi:hypothetical protein